METNNIFSEFETSKNKIKKSKIPSVLRETYSQAQEDLIVESILINLVEKQNKTPDEIFYIEIGANHPIETSNTYLFYRKYGARGILVEANPELITDLKKARPRDFILQCAISASNEPFAIFNVCEIAELSSINRAHIDSFNTESNISEIKVANIHINKFLAEYAPTEIDFLSIDIEGLDEEILLALDFTKFRPSVVQCEPSEHFMPGMASKMREIMEANDYVIFGKTKINLIFVDRRKFTFQTNTAVQTFDIFDTLITRRCIHPHNVFKRIEEEFPMPGFHNLRIEAESRISTKEYTISDIYRELGKISGLEKDLLTNLMNLEIAIEVDESIPIRRNLDRVRDGDILVSDMYLDDPTIRNLLKKSGLNKRIGIIITSHGKSKGYIWKKLKDKFLLTQHIGDNPISDLQSAHHNKIPAILTNISAPDPIESWMIDNGMDYLGKFLREFRLSLKEKIGFERLRYVQTHLNAPILLLASILLLRYYPKAYNILFCSRDCNQWFELYLRVANHIKPPITSEYFYTSRISRSNPSPDYLKYARSRIKENSVVVDLCGSGWSLRRLLDRINLKECNAFFLHALDPIKHYEEIYKPSANLNITSIISGSSISNIEIEMANYASHGQTLDVTSIDGIEIPIFDARTYSNNISEAISIQRNTFLNMVKHIPDLSIQQVASFDNQSLKLVIDQLYKIVSKEMVLSEFFGSAHHTEDSHVMFDLSLQKRFVA